ncbi:hypothetical protein MKW98_000432 [Papaver atlanticum]|uniref:Uncharacterized protein n=1 Tax=Papaver atlanticum TaxID=357466 RepID=A0AAD4S3M9_9MAGN|nr:hypothetical protein MKW98_000432 [Papaver atlanticum]
MVEAIVSFAVQRLGDAFIKEAVSLYGVCEQVQKLGNELRRMLCFLKDADSKEQQGDALVRNWILEIRDVAYDSEDVILKVMSRERGGIMNLLIKSACILNTGKHQYKVGKEIQSILGKLQNISDSRVKYDIKSIRDEETPSSVANQKLQQQLRRSYPHVEDEDVIRLEEHTSELIAELTKEEERRCVISIVGVGGLGKTTLAKTIYRQNIVKNHFQFCAWTFVSQRCSRKDILKEILKKASASSDELGKIENKNEEDLVQLLYKYLKDKRYLVVLHDIWSSEAWDILGPAFPNGVKGSKVLLTTRNKEVALHADPRSLHLEPRFLTDEESWGLLCKKAVLRTNTAETNISPGLQKIGREMVRKCGGLPLRVTVLGGLLTTKKTDITEWEIVQRNMNTHMNRGQNGVMEILSLSYNDLPYHLKPCFLYLGLFPEDCHIPARKMIQLWTAEGFMPQLNGYTMEDLGEQQYLAELIERCMVQVSKRSLTGRVKTCRLHDLMRDLCLLRAREENFLDIHHKEDAEPPTTHCKFRRLAMHKGEQGYTYLENSPHLRTLVYIPYQNSYLFYNVQLHHQNVKLLRVLDLRGVYDDTKGNITKQIGKLIHLRYLGLTNIQIGKISPTISNLRYLQTLDLSGYFGTVPETIQKMEQLRHLHLYYGHKHLQLGILINLQTLKWVTAGRWMIEGGLIKMTNLRKLGLCELLGSDLEEILDSIVHRLTDHNPLRSLYLHLNVLNQEFFPNMERLSQCDNLHKPSMSGFCQENYFKFPPNITKLTLAWTCFFQDPWADLQHLLNLKYLDMRSAYNGEELVCRAKGFPQLQHLHLKKLPHLKQFRVHKGGMPNLKHLEISNCSKLVMLPRGLKFVTTIQKLEINNMPSDFQARVSKKGPEWYKVRHISSITFKVEPETIIF